MRQWSSLSSAVAGTPAVYVLHGTYRKHSSVPPALAYTCLIPSFHDGDPIGRMLQDWRGVPQV